MAFNFFNESSRETIILAYDKLLNQVRKAHSDNLKLANFWGRTHMLLGATTAMLSSVSAVFTFFSNQNVAASLAIAAAISASLFTSLSPSSREAKRRYTATIYWKLLNRIEESRAIDCLPSIPEKRMLNKLKDLNSEFRRLIDENIDLIQ